MIHMANDDIASEPLRIGVILFPGFQALDAFGPLDCINVLSQTEHLTLSLLSSTLDPVTTTSPAMPAAVGQSVVPTHTFSNAPPLDVLLIPGGQGTRSADTPVQEAVTYIRGSYPRLQYLITVCTGSRLAARAGVLDGKRATTNKMHFREDAGRAPGVNWIPRARWVTDGNVWTASGVSAGIDVTLAWVEEVYGKEKATQIADELEYERHEDLSYDPFAARYGLC
ncbi:uncharacterized protein N7459_000347 [Penicillium hispanicum]|uniref:uncharacterized protein n=1 Tax=Penicillium hispanicum TaxID=1080232 RepID=UPI00253FB442|nr:uncharacterized protein N7459_000347 [Penicillium hispanicum]KAJ5594139.1 hypothetical protein N7459_000347 [Penicillium hispanicum]